MKKSETRKEMSNAMNAKHLLLGLAVGLAALPVFGKTCCDAPPVAARTAESLAASLAAGEAWLGVFDVPPLIRPQAPGKALDYLPGLFELRTRHNVVPLQLAESLQGEIPEMVFMVDPRHGRVVLDQPSFPFVGALGSRWLLCVVPENRDIVLPDTLEASMGYHGDASETLKQVRTNAVRLAGNEHGTMCLHYPDAVAKRMDETDPDWRERNMAYAFGDEKVLEDVRRVVRFHQAQQARKDGQTNGKLEPISFQTEFGAILFKHLQDHAKERGVQE